MVFERSSASVNRKDYSLLNENIDFHEAQNWIINGLYYSKSDNKPTDS